MFISELWLKKLYEEPIKDRSLSQAIIRIQDVRHLPSEVTGPSKEILFQESVVDLIKYQIYMLRHLVKKCLIYFLEDGLNFVEL